MSNNKDSPDKGDEPNPPNWPTDGSVKLVRPSMSKEEIDALIGETQDPWKEEFQTFTSDFHFSSRRFVVMFAPGVYKGIDVQVGYYTQLVGLGASADDVVFEECDKGPYCPALNFHVHASGTSLDSFWRSAENFASKAADLKWAVSQAAPLRRVHVHGKLTLFDGAAYASGGHLANSRIEGLTHAGGQQQFLYRHVHLEGGAEGGAWSMVHVGCTGKVPLPSSGGPAKSVTVWPVPRIRMEKPFVALHEDGKRFVLRVPLPLRSETDVMVGPLMDGSHEEARDFTRVRVVSATEPSPTLRIQEALDQGKDVVLAPGIFNLEDTLVVRHPNQVVLGLGLATLVAPTNGNPCIHVLSGLPAVRIAGLMLEATAANPTTKTLLQWGDDETTASEKETGDPNNPGAMFDIFCRVGGATLGDRTAVRTETMMRIFSPHVMGDNLWLWRADHGQLREGEEANYPHISKLYWQSEETEFRVETGLEVKGDDVTMFGLAVEHANGNQTVWSGDRGFVAFYQNELPYGVSQTSFGDKGFVGYKVDDSVTHHTLLAPGIYSNFRNGEVITKTGLVYPEKDTIQVVNPFTIRLDNHYGIESVANGKGLPAKQQGLPMRLSSTSTTTMG